jgi:hypothetical protein
MTGNDAGKTISKPGPSDFASPVELRGNGAGIYHLTDGVSDEDFEDAVAAAKAEQDLSRANIVRKIRQHRIPAPPGPGGQVPAAASTSGVARQPSRDLIARYAAAGMSSQQIASRLGDGTLILTLGPEAQTEHRRLRRPKSAVVKVPGLARGSQLTSLYQELLNLVFLLRGNPVVKGILQ